MIAPRRAAPTSADHLDLAHQVIQLACRAPSVHNTQPWRWRIDGPHIELRADRRRQLDASDGSGRNLAISCGAALHHLRIAAAGLGRAIDVTRLPNVSDPDLVAVVELGRPLPVQPADTDLLDALERRVTDRRRFTSWPVPEERLDHLAADDERWGTRVLALHGDAARHTLESIVEWAMEVHRGDPRRAEEQRRWTGRTSPDGVPLVSLPPQEHLGERRDRFDRIVDPAMETHSVERSDGVLVICTARDDVRAWLDTGEALSSLWLRATSAGLSVVPLSQVIEVPEARQALSDQLFFAMARPQLLVRIGWQEVSRSPMPHPPRRPLEEVLDEPGTTTVGITPRADRGAP